MAADKLNGAEAFEGLVDDAMRSKGWLLPTTEDLVADVEAELDGSLDELPESLRSASTVFEAISTQRVSRPSQNDERPNATAQNLALAAREGGEIALEVREAMKRNREATEREYDRKRKDST